MTAPYLETRGVYKRFGRAVVLRDVTLQVTAGESIALLGANGAGKSTLLRLLATLSRPTRGMVLAFGDDAWETRDSVRSRVGVVAHQPFVYPELSCLENLTFFATMFKLDRDRTVPAALEAVGLSSRRDSPASTLSRGLLQRLNLARAILHAPDVLILDEPDTGLDRDGRQVLAGIIDAQRERDGAVIFTTHSYEFGLKQASRIVALQDGNVSLDRPVDLVAADELDSFVGARWSRADVVD